MSLQTEFTQRQISEFAQQAQGLGKAYTKSAASAANNPGPTKPPRE
jgi:hypothetical protein